MNKKIWHHRRFIFTIIDPCELFPMLSAVKSPNSRRRLTMTGPRSRDRFRRRKTNRTNKQKMIEAMNLIPQ